MALKFLNKKGWHTGSLRNIENVWKAEQKHEAEAKKLEELKKQIQDEREAQEFRLLQEQAGLIPKQERLEFLYDSGLAVGKVSTDEYLLGKPVEPEKAQSEIEKVAATPGSLFVEEKPQSANDQWRKLHSDPLLLIRQQEQAALARIKNNPVKMEMIKKSIVEKISKKEKKHRNKEKKHKEKKRKRKHSSESEESMDKAQNKDKEKDKADDVHDGYRNSRKEGREAEYIQHISRNEHPRRRHDSPDSEREMRQNAFQGHGSPRKRHDSPDYIGERRRDANGRQRSPRRGHSSPDSVGRKAYTRQESPRKRHDDSPDYVAEQKRDGYARNRSIKAARSSKEHVSSKQSTGDSDERHDSRSSPKRGFNRHDSRNLDGGEPKHDTHREDESGKMRMSFKERDLTKAKNNIQQERYDRSRSPRRMSRSPRSRENYSWRHDDSPKRESRSWRCRSPHRNQYERRRGCPDVSDIDRPGLRSSKNKEIADEPKVEANGREGVGSSTSELNRQSNKSKVGKLSEEEKAERLRAMQMDAEIHEEQRWHRLKKASDADKLEEARATSNKGKNFLDSTARNIYGAAAEGQNNASVEESVRRRAHFIKRSIGDSNENTFQRS